jgi:mycothione reductase
MRCSTYLFICARWSILVQPLVNAMRFGETVDQLAHDTFYIHPALTEVVEQALLEIAPPAAP